METPSSSYSIESSISSSILSGVSGDRKSDTVSLVPSQISLQSDPKYKNYANGVEKCLRNFECSSEWPDLISALSKLIKVLSSSAAKYDNVPKRHLLCKRLSQCLHPNLPAGVHMKALEVYDLVFRSLSKETLNRELFTYSAGLFPLWSYANMSVRPVLLDLFENHFLALGSGGLRPAVDGILICTLSGLSDEALDQDFIHRTVAFIRGVRKEVGNIYFDNHIWHVIEKTPTIRRAGVNFILQETGNPDGGDIFASCKDDPEVVCSCLEKCIVDKNILVQRSTLDLLLSHFPLNKNIETEDSEFFSYSQILRLVSSSLFTLLRRDMSLNRRLFQWILGYENDDGSLGTPVGASDQESLMSNLSLEKEKEEFVRRLLVESLRFHLSNVSRAAPNEDNDALGISGVNYSLSEIVRIMISLFDRPILNSLLLDEILVDFMTCMRRIHLKSMENESMESSSLTTTIPFGEEKNRIPHDANLTIQIGNMFFMNLLPSYVYDYLLSLVKSGFKNSWTNTDFVNIHGESSKKSLQLSEACQIVEYIISLDLPALTTFTDKDSDHGQIHGSGYLMGHLLLGVMDMAAMHLKKESTFEGLEYCFQFMELLTQKVKKAYVQGLRSMEIDIENTKNNLSSQGTEPKTSLSVSYMQNPVRKLGSLLKDQIIPTYLNVYEKFLYAKFFRNANISMEEIESAFWKKLDRKDKLRIMRDEETLQSSLTAGRNILDSQISYWNQDLKNSFETVLFRSFHEGIDEEVKEETELTRTPSTDIKPSGTSLDLLNNILFTLSRVEFKVVQEPELHVTSTSDGVQCPDKESFPLWLQMLILLIVSDSEKSSGEHWTQVRIECCHIITHILIGTSGFCPLLLSPAQLVYLKKFTYVYEVLASFLWRNIGLNDAVTDRCCSLLYNLSIQCPVRIEKYISSNLSDYASYTRLIHLLRKFEGSSKAVGMMDSCILKLLNNLDQPNLDLEIQCTVQEWIRTQLTENNLTHVLDPLLFELIYQPQLRSRSRIQPYIHNCWSSSERNKSDGTDSKTLTQISQEDEDMSSSLEGSFFVSYQQNYEKAAMDSDNGIRKHPMITKMLSSSTPDLCFQTDLEASKQHSIDKDDTPGSMNSMDDSSADVSIRLVNGGSRSTGDIHLECQKDMAGSAFGNSNNSSSSISSISSSPPAPTQLSNDIADSDQCDEPVSGKLMLRRLDATFQNNFGRSFLKENPFKRNAKHFKEMIGDSPAFPAPLKASRKPSSFAPLFVYTGNSVVIDADIEQQSLEKGSLEQYSSHEYDARRVLYVMDMIENLIRLCPHELINCLCINLLSRSEERFTRNVLKVLIIKSNRSSEDIRNSTYLEFLLDILLQFAVSLIPTSIVFNDEVSTDQWKQAVKSGSKLVTDNLRVQVKSLNLIRILLDQVYEFIIASGGKNCVQSLELDESTNKRVKGMNSMLFLPNFLSYTYYFNAKCEEPSPKMRPSSIQGASPRLLGFIGDLITHRLRLSRNILDCLQTSLHMDQVVHEDNIMESNKSIKSELGCIEKLVIFNYGQVSSTTGSGTYDPVSIWQYHLLRLTASLIRLESQLSFNEPSTKTLSFPKLSNKSLKRTITATSLEKQRQQYQQSKYMINSPLTVQPKFIDVLTTALKSNLNSIPVPIPQQPHPHFNWTRMVVDMIPYMKEKNYPTKLTQIIILTITQLTKNLVQIASKNSLSELFFYYLSPALDGIIQIMHSLLLSDLSSQQVDPAKKDSTGNAPGSNLYGILTSFLPGTGSSPQPPTGGSELGVDNGLELTKRDLLTRFHTILNTCVLLWEKCSAKGAKSELHVKLREKILNLLSPLAHNYTTSFIQSFMFLETKVIMKTSLIDLIHSMKILRLDSITEIILNLVKKNSKNNACLNNVLIFYRLYLTKEEVEKIPNLNPNSIISLLKECANANIPELNLTSIEVLLIILPLVFDQQKSSDASSTSSSAKQKKLTSEMKELQDVCLKILDLIVVHASSNLNCLQTNSYLSSSTSDNYIINSADSEKSRSSSADSNVRNTFIENDKQVLNSVQCLSCHLPHCIDLLWTDDNKDKEKTLLTWLSHAIFLLLPFLKLRKTKYYKGIVELLANLSGYDYLRKAWKKEIFDHIMLENNFFVFESECLSSWKVIIDNLFTQEDSHKTTFNELLTRVSMPHQNVSLSLFSGNKESECESRALCIKKLAFVLWASEKDHHAKFITNIQEKISEAVKVPYNNNTSGSQIVTSPSILHSVFLCFRVMLLKFTNLSGFWPIIIHEIVQVLTQMETELIQRDGIFDMRKKVNEWGNLYLQTCKLLDMVLSHPAIHKNTTGSHLVFQTFSWAFAPSFTYYNINSEIFSSLEDRICPTTEFLPYLSRVSMCLCSSPHSLRVTENKVSRADLYYLKKIDGIRDLWRPFFCRFSPKGTKYEFYWPKSVCPDSFCDNIDYVSTMESFIQMDFLE